MNRLLCIALTVLGACTTRAQAHVSQQEEHGEPEPAIAGAGAADHDDPSPDTRTAHALAAEIAAALVEPSITRAQALDAVRRDWQGKRYRWQVGVSAPLCSGPDVCNVLPFDHAAIEARIVQGWLPRLRLADSDHAELLERCGEGVCVATIEATLSSFVLSTEDPTSLTFSDVLVADVRPRRENESWVRRKSDPRLANLRRGK